MCYGNVLSVTGLSLGLLQLIVYTGVTEKKRVGAVWVFVTLAVTVLNCYGFQSWRQDQILKR